MESQQEIEINKPNLSSFSSNFNPLQSAPAQYQLTKTNVEESSTPKYNYDSYQSGYVQPNYNYYQTAQYEMMFDPFLAKRYVYLNEKIPRAKHYKSDSTIYEAFPHLTDINNEEFTMENIHPDAKFFFMRSSNDDDIHKSIKYGTWSSTAPCNQKLEKTYSQFLEANPDVEPQVYLIYSVVNTKNLLGVARMESHYNVDDTFRYWLESDKYKGSYKIKWLFIKDVAFTRVEDSQDGQMNLKNLKDGAELSLEVGKSILQSFIKQSPRPNIFDTFEYMDRREDAIRHMRDNEIYPVHSAMFKRPFRKPMGGRQYNSYRYNNTERQEGNSNNSGEGRFNSSSNLPSSTSGNSGSFRNNYGYRYDNGYKNRNYDNSQKNQDLSSVFIVRDANSKQQKRNRGGYKKRNQFNGNSTAFVNSKDDKVDAEFWNNRPKMTNQNYEHSDEEAKDVDRQ